MRLLTIRIRLEINVHMSRFPPLTKVIELVLETIRAVFKITKFY